MGVSKIKVLLISLTVFTLMNANIVINEVMSNVEGSDSDTGSPGDRNEYIELYNLSEDSINILNFKISDGTASDNIIMYSDTFVYPGGITGDSIIPPNSYIVLLDPEYSSVGDSVNYMPYHIPDSAYVFSISTTTFGDNGLSTKDNIFLLTLNDSVIDVFGTPEIDDDFPFDPGDGISLEKINPYYDDKQASFKASVDTSGNTIGKDNSVYIAGAVIDSFVREIREDSAIISVYLSLPENCTDKLIIEGYTYFDTLTADTIILSFELSNIENPVINLKTLIENKTITILCNDSIQQSGVIFNEFMVSGENEWIELYNGYKIPFYLNGLVLQNGNESVALTGGVILSDSFLVITNDTSTLKGNYPPLKMSFCECDLFNLPDREDTFYLSYREQILDSVIRGYEGSPNSIERICRMIDGYRNDNWDVSISEYGATPSFENSLNAVDNIITDSINIIQQIITRENPVLCLKIKISSFKSELTVRIYSDMGVFLDEPISRRYISNDETIVIKRLDERLKNGIYYLFVEIVSDKENIRKIIPFAVRQK